MTRRDRIVKEGGITKLGCMKNTEKIHLTLLKKRDKKGKFGK